MKRLENVSLASTPYRLSYRRYTDRDFNGHFHCHQGMEFLFVYNGQGHITVGRQIIEVEPGTLFFFQPFQLHRIQMDVSPQQPYERTIVSFEPAIFEAYFEAFPQLRQYYRRLWQDALPMQMLQGLAGESEISRMFELFHRRLSQIKASDYQHEFALLTVRMLHALQDMGFGDNAMEESGEGMEAMRPKRHSESMMGWIEEHYHETFTLSQLAEELHLTKTYISRVFREETGSSLMEYVTARRIRQASWLLHETDLPVEHIGEKVGFPNFSYFCQVYKKHIGISPNQSRKRRI
jgi:AraC-like DNA-binding protein